MRIDFDPRTWCHHGIILARDDARVLSPSVTPLDPPFRSAPFLVCLTHSAPSLSKGDLDIIKTLVKEGEAQVDEEALSLAREHGHQKVAEFLLTHVDLYAGLVDETDIMDKACREGDIAKVRQLLEGADIDQWKDEEGRFLACSPVHLAMRHGHMELIQLFAEKGMRVDINDEAPAAAESNPPNH